MLVSERPSLARIQRLTSQNPSQEQAQARGLHSRQDIVLRVVGQRALAAAPLETLPRANGMPEPAPTASPSSGGAVAAVEARAAGALAGTHATTAATTTTTSSTSTGTSNVGTPTARTGAGTTTATTGAAPMSPSAALAKLREASVSLRGVDLVDYNRDWARQMVESGTASNPAFYQLLERASAAIKEAYRKHLGREPTKDEMAMWLPFTPSMEANERQWATNLQRLEQRANLEQVAATIAARTSSSAPPLTDAQIADFIRANLQNPNAITAAMLQYGVSFARIQAALGASAADIAAYVASSNNDTLKRLYAEQTGAPATSTTTAPVTTSPTPSPTTTPAPTPTTTTPTTSAPAVSDAQIADFIRANLQNPDAIAAAMLQYGVGMSRLQAAIGASWDEVRAYVAASNNDTLKRLLVEAIGPG